MNAGLSYGQTLTDLFQYKGAKRSKLRQVLPIIVQFYGFMNYGKMTIFLGIINIISSNIVKILTIFVNIVKDFDNIFG